MRSLRAALVLAGLLSSTACYHLYPESRTHGSFTRQDGAEGQRRIDIQFMSSMPSHFDSHARCSLARLDAVRALPEFSDTILRASYDFSGQPEQLKSTEKVLECVKRPLTYEWRARHCPWIHTWPFKIEVGSTSEDEQKHVWKTRTYDCEITGQDTAELAGHFLHEHMHTCGYVDGGGNKGGQVPTYVINDLVEAMAKNTEVCPGL